MVTNWSVSEDDLYGPPPAYSVNPLSSIYIIPETRNVYHERPTSHASIVLSLKLQRYLFATGLLHTFVGVAAIICDILSISINGSYSFTSFWAGILCITLGIYLISFMKHPKKQSCSLQRFKFIHIITCLIIMIALILLSLNLASDFCHEMYFQSDQCENAGKKLKIIIAAFCSVTLIQICVTFVVTLVHTG